MRNWFTVVCFAVFIIVGGFAGCSSNDNNAVSWEQIHEMVDYGAFRSDIDDAVYKADPKTHEASKTVVNYFMFCRDNLYGDAWNLIEPESPFSFSQSDLSSFETAWKEAKKQISYGDVAIVGIEIHKIQDKIRFVDVSFDIDMTMLSTGATVKNTGKYTLSDKSGEWLLWSMNIEGQ